MPASVIVGCAVNNDAEDFAGSLTLDALSMVLNC